MALYAFDGTWNKNEAEEGADTNVVKFAETYTEETCYQPGVGTRYGKLGKIFGGLSARQLSAHPRNAPQGRQAS